MNIESHWSETQAAACNSCGVGFTLKEIQTEVKEFYGYFNDSLEHAFYLVIDSNFLIVSLSCNKFFCSPLA